MGLLEDLKIAAHEAKECAAQTERIKLTNEQRATLGGSTKRLIDGGPGVGKSSVLTAYLSQCIEEGRDPSATLVVSFSNRTCRDLATRFAATLENRVIAQIKVWTLHKLAIKIVDEFAEQLGRPSKPKLFDDRRATHAMRNACLSVANKASKEGASRLNHPSDDDLKVISAEISRCKANLITSSEYEAKARSVYEHEVGAVYAAYEAILRSENGLDFGGYVMEAARLLNENEEVCGLVQEMYSTILIDEFQDVDLAMFTLLTQIAKPHDHVFVACDPDQSIYEFRSGLGPLAEKLFRQAFPEAKVFFLTANARNAAGIVRQANESRCEPKRAQTALKPNGPPLYFVQASSAQDEQQQLVDMIERALVTGRYRRSDIAVLCRTTHLLTMVEAELLQRHVAYAIVGRDGFFDRHEIRDILAYARLALGNDLYYLMQVVNTPARTLTKKALDAIRGEHPEVTLKMLLDVESIKIKAGESAAQGAHQLWQCVQMLQDNKTLQPAEMIDLILGGECNYLSCLSKNANESEQQMTRIEQLYKFAASFDDLRTFLEAVDQMNGEAAFVEAQDAVQVMTLHSAKGLEFPIVFIPGLEDGTIPHFRTLTSDSDLAAERRLLVMGMTRAQEYLIFLRARERNGQRVDASVFSRKFLRELFDPQVGQPDFMFGHKSEGGMGDG